MVDNWAMPRRLMSPPRDGLRSLRTPLTAGELGTVDFFDSRLPAGWEIYVQPHMNGLRPDVVLLHPDVGAAVFEVKDWNLTALSYVPARGPDDAHLMATDAAGRTFRVRSPLAKLALYSREIPDLYCPS